MSSFTPSVAHGPLRSFGRIKSRALKPRQAALFDTLLPQVALPDPVKGPLDPQGLMPGAEAVWLEIGFGGGEHLAEQARRHPTALMIGCEPFVNGVGSALRHIEEMALTNVRVHAGDARDVLNALPDGSLDRVMVLFPDPWPKARHNKRRLVQEDSAAAMARVLKPGGRLRFVTDWKDYADWALERFLKTPGLEWQAQSQADWSTAPQDHVTTRYEEKKLGDTAPIFLEFIRV
ncbi:tRNA (guanine-N7)-methyltransferase [Brevundimonas sp. Leaf363]|uniref:tRNA (guanosine(46)-N7)-methyltransferase TrmB n=1 Tax=Brevundimonas sp. Leaf363 TaxID=1736353 RepID=UPI0006F2E53C|nr:tRNA (guanosine(46)-N7)-methyltransferase TrmB [Brevundimonas sp. Leaf363]KQS57523.1 tRNA (guanine-N7)-methyltransferase [Brevundimonas sp. Leaf363]